MNGFDNLHHFDVIRHATAFKRDGYAVGNQSP